MRLGLLEQGRGQEPDAYAERKSEASSDEADGRTIRGHRAAEMSFRRTDRAKHAELAKTSLAQDRKSGRRDEADEQ